MYKNLFIDLDDTLWAFSKNSKDTFYEVYDLLNYDTYFDSFDHFYSLYQSRNAELWLEYGKGNISKEELNKQRFLYPLIAVNVAKEELAQRFAELFFAKIPTKAKLMPHVQEALAYLTRNYRLYILSNGFRELQYQKMCSSGIESYFRKIILSEDIHVFKPYPEIFHFALSATQSDLKESLMIGDSWDADIVGARGVNMDQMYYCPDWQEKKMSFKPTFLLTSWANIRDYL